MLHEANELSQMTLPQLREQLRKAHLPVSGNKAVLVERLLAAPPVEAADAAMLEIEACKS